MADSVNILSSDLRNKVRKDFPFVPGAWVEFYDDLTPDAIIKAQSASQTDIQENLQIILVQIADWNFADDTGLLPITMDSLKRLPMKYLTWMGQAQATLFEDPAIDDKKKVSPVAS